MIKRYRPFFYRCLKSDDVLYHRTCLIGWPGLPFANSVFIGLGAKFTFMDFTSTEPSISM
jgi:hypothetical protein